jgi:hypothetical protein
MQPAIQHWGDHVEYRTDIMQREKEVYMNELKEREVLLDIPKLN